MTPLVTGKRNRSLDQITMRAILSAVVLSFGIGCGFSSEPYRVDVKQKVSAEYTDAIDHLEPVRGVIPEFYYIAQYIESPSFTKGTYMVVLKTKEDKYLLQLATTPADSRPIKRPKNETELEISESLAEVIYQIWVNALLEVRYDRKCYRGLDGADYTFSSFVRGTGWMHGSIWTPQADLPPKWLVDSAREIIAFARDPKRDEKKIEATLIQSRDKLFAYLKK